MYGRIFFIIIIRVLFTVASWLSVPLTLQVTGSVATTVNNIGIIVREKDR